MDFVMVNGEIVRAGEANLTPLVWDNPHLIHRKIWFGFGGIPLWEENLLLLADELEILGAEIPDVFKNKRELPHPLRGHRGYRTGQCSFNHKSRLPSCCGCIGYFARAEH